MELYIFYVIIVLFITCFLYIYLIKFNIQNENDIEKTNEEESNEEYKKNNYNNYYYQQNKEQKDQNYSTQHYPCENDFLNNEYYQEQDYLFEEEFKKEYELYISEYKDLDYYDYIGIEQDLYELYTNLSSTNDKYNFQSYITSDYQVNSLNNIQKNKNQEPIKTTKDLKYNKNQSIMENKDKIDEYIISLFGEELVEKRNTQKQEINKIKDNTCDDVDKYLKMFFGENCDLDKLKNNQEKR